MIEDGPETIPDATGEGLGSSVTVEDGQGAMETTVQDDVRTLTDPVGCAKPRKSSESKHLKDARPLSCDTSVLHTSPPSQGLTDCPHEDFSDSGCRTTVEGRVSSLSHMRGASAGMG